MKKLKDIITNYYEYYEHSEIWGVHEGIKWRVIHGDLNFEGTKCSPNIIVGTMFLKGFNDEIIFQKDFGLTEEESIEEIEKFLKTDEYKKIQKRIKPKILKSYEIEINQIKARLEKDKSKLDALEKMFSELAQELEKGE